MKNGGGVSFVIDLTTESEAIGNTELQTVQVDSEDDGGSDDDDDDDNDEDNANSN